MNRPGLTTARALFAVLLIVAPTWTAPAWAAPSRDPEATIVDDLVVTAREAGPAWWRVSKGASVVWVLGVPVGLPKGYKWDTRFLDAHLVGAHQAITPPVSTASLFSIPAILSLRGKMKTPAPLEDSLPPDLRARFIAGARALGQDPGKYDRWNGLYAGFLMVSDFRKAGRMDNFDPMPAIDHAVRAHGLRPKPAAVYKAMPILKEGVAELNAEVEQACLSDALDEIEGGRDRQVRAAQGWGRGDVRVALNGGFGFDHCMNMLPEGARLARQAMADEAGAIAAVLDQPGAAVAVLPLRPLLAQGGVLEQLRAKGYAIRTPDR